MNLIIVESPTKAKTLSRFLGKDYEIAASMGHVRDLPKSKLGVDVEHDFEPEYVEIRGRGETIKDLKVKAKTAKRVILATDPDREGEAIAYHIKYLLSNGVKCERIVFHEITKTAVEQALKKPGIIKQNLVDAQQGRRVLDRLVGYKLSPLLWRKVRRGLSAGRVQSVTVKLIVEREREIGAFKPQEYWEFKVKVAQGSEVFVVDLVKIKDKAVAINDKAEAEVVRKDLEKGKYVVSGMEKQVVKKSPPPPFMTSTLQRAAANYLSWTSKRTMRAAQRLYEQGLITYHRTDSLNIAQIALKNVGEYIRNKYGAEYGLVTPRYFKSRSKSAQEAHEAIRPTQINSKLEIGNLKSTAPEQKLYEMIWKRFVASQMAQALFDKLKIEVTSDKYLLKAVGETCKFDGWLKLNGKWQMANSKLPEVKVGDNLNKKKVMVEQKFTQPKARYSEASLIKALESRGIGRPSTYAPTISTIQIRQYVEKKERQFYPTSVGVAVYDFLQKYFEQIMDYEFTAKMETDLDNIAEGRKNWKKVIKTFYMPFEKLVKGVGEKAERVKVKVEKTGKKCKECKRGDEVIRIGRFGKFLSCSRFPECKYTGTYMKVIEGIICPEDRGEVVMRKTRKGKQFYGCKNYPKCKWASWRKPK